MTAFPKYPAYKDSGVEWLGEVPEHWGVERLKGSLREIDVRTTTGTETLLSLRMNVGLVPHNEVSTLPITNAQLVGYKKVAPGQVVMNRMRASSGIFAVSTTHGLVSPDYAVFEPKGKQGTDYLLSLFKTGPMMTEFRRYSTGLGTGESGFLRLYSNFFFNIRCPIPPKAEEDRIVAFLDEKTAQIDALIAKKQRQIELLDEQKAILINRAVTRGLHPNPDLQDSGIPWIGPIPKGWEVKSAKHACERIIDCKNRTAEVVTNGDYYVLRTSNVKKGELVRDEITRTNLKNFTIWTERGAPQAGDVLFTREAPAGEACVFDGSLPACLGQRMMYFRPDTSQLLPQFLVHTIYFGPSATYIQLKTNGSTVGHLRLPDVYALPVLLPPVDEQKRILEALAATDESQKKLIQTMESQIQTLQTLRSTLIAHAVTGKMRVE